MLRSSKTRESSPSSLASMNTEVATLNSQRILLLGSSPKETNERDPSPTLPVEPEFQIDSIPFADSSRLKDLLPKTDAVLLDRRDDASHMAEALKHTEPLRQHLPVIAPYSSEDQLSRDLDFIHHCDDFILVDQLSKTQLSARIRQSKHKKRSNSPSPRPTERPKTHSHPSANYSTPSLATHSPAFSSKTRRADSSSPIKSTPTTSASPIRSSSRAKLSTTFCRRRSRLRSRKSTRVS